MIGLNRYVTYSIKNDFRAWDPELFDENYHKYGNRGVHMTDILTLPETLRFTEDGLIPAIAQQFDTGEVLMMAWMNKDSLVETLATGRVCYWSRSRRTFWRKGDTSGHFQKLVELRYDCDADTILILVDQTGAACHKGSRTCFTKRLDIHGHVSNEETAFPANTRTSKQP